MPQLISFLACRTVIVDEQSKNMSLIGLLDVIRAADNEDLQPDIVAPIDWNIFTWWESEPHEQGVAFQQQVTLVNPIGEEVFTAIGEFIFTTPKHRVVARAPVFPIFHKGKYEVRLSLLEQDSWKYISTYAIYVEHVSPELLPAPFILSPG